MKVSQLIEALERMDPDALVITYANNHYASPETTFAVASGDHYSGKEVVIIGNWRADSFRDRNLVPKGMVWSVPSYGDDAGMLNAYTIQHNPGKVMPLRVYRDIPESWSFVKLPIDELPV